MWPVSPVSECWPVALPCRASGFGPECPMATWPPPGKLCAATQVAHTTTIESKVSFVADIGKPPALCFLFKNSLGQTPPQAHR